MVSFQIGEVFAHVPMEEVEDRTEQMKEVSSKKLEKDSIVAQMAELKKIVYGRFRPCLVGSKFSVFCIQTFRKQEKHV